MSAFSLKKMHSVTYTQTKMFWQCNEIKDTSPERHSENDDKS